jgi:hypothetical protein
MTWRRAASLSLLILMLSGPGGPAGAGTADQVGATFGLLIQDVVAAFPPVEGLVVQVDGDRVFLDVTEQNGVQPGQEFSVFRKGEVFRHPMNGRPLGRYEDILGYAQIVRVHPQYSEALFVPEDGKPPVQPEDGVRITKGRIRVAVAPATDLTKAQADLRRVPFMLAHALEQTKRFQVADPSTVQEHLLRGVAREPGQGQDLRQDPGGHRLAGAGAHRAPRRDLSRRHLGVSGHRDRALLPARGPVPVGRHGRAAVPVGAASNRLTIPEANGKTGV